MYIGIPRITSKQPTCNYFYFCLTQPRILLQMPLYPTINRVRTEVPIRGMLAMAMNGVPTYGPQESDSLNAVEGMGVPGARFWYGHTGGNSAWVRFSWSASSNL
jgi:hypothetical protein